MSVTRYQSKIRYYREVIQATSTTHNRVRFKKLDGTYISPTGVAVTASSNPISGNLSNLLSVSGETCVFGADKLVTITVDLNQVYDVNAIEVRHATSGTFNKVLVQASTDGVSWYTLYDSTLDGTYPEVTAGVLFNSSYEIEVADRSAIILDVEDNAPFDPKQMIWENDKKLMEYFESLVERAQHYILGSSSTNKALILESLTGLYPANYFESMMVYWVHRTTADSVNDATIKVGNLVAKPLIQQGQETITLTEGEPYIAIYDISIGKFKLLSGGGSGLAGKINTVQATNNFSKYDLGAFDKATGTFVSPDLNLENPILAEAILLPKSYGFEGYINGMVEIPGMLDVDGNAIESGEVYFVSQTNNKKVTKVQPEGGLVQPFMQTYMSRGKLYAMLMQTDSFYGDSGTVWTSGRGFRTNGNVLELDAVDGEVRTDSPRFEVAVTEKDLVGFAGRKVDTIEDLKKVKHAKVDDIVFVSGFHVKGDGSHHLRIAKSTDDGSGELGVDGIWWCILHDGEVNVSWFGAKGDGITDDTLSIQKTLTFGEKYTTDFIIFNDGRSSSFFTIDFGARVHIITSPLYLFNKSNLGGTGGGIVLKRGTLKSGANIDFIIKITDKNNYNWTQDIVVKEMNFDCNKISPTSILAEKCRFITIQNCAFSNFTGENIKASNNAYNLMVLNCDIFGKRYKYGETDNRTGRIGVRAGVDTLVEDSTITDCDFGIQTSSWSRISSNHIYSCNYAIRLGGQFNIVTENYLENNLIGNFQDSIISNNAFRSEKTSLMYHEASSSVGAFAGCKIIGNHFGSKTSSYDIIVSSVTSTEVVFSLLDLKSTNIDLGSVIEYSDSRIIVTSINGDVATCMIISGTDFMVGTLSISTAKCLTTSNTIYSFYGDMYPQNAYTNFNRRPEPTSEVNNKKQNFTYATQYNQGVGDGTGNFSVGEIGGGLHFGYVYKTSQNAGNARMWVDGKVKTIGFGTQDGNVFTMGQTYINPHIDLEVDLGSPSRKYKYIYCDRVIQTTLSSLDTPYYARKMEEEGIYEDFVDYMDSLNTNPLARPSEPQPSERLLEFAKRYNIN